MNTIIFACVHNAGRSQMAAAFFNQLVDSRKAKAISAGTQPAISIYSNVKKAMLEVNIDLGTEEPKLLTLELSKGADYLITMGCKEACPFIPTALILDWEFEDPNGKSIEEVRVIRDQIKNRVHSFLAEKLWLP